MGINFPDTTKFTPIGFARFLLDSTESDGTLHIPKNFGTEFESDDEFNIFKMSWGREELDQLILKFNALYAGLSEIAKVYDELDDNDAEHVRSVLDDSALFDIWRIYVRRLECDEFDNDKLDFALEKEYNQNMFSENPDKQLFDERLFEKFTEDELDLLEKYHSKQFEESIKRLGGNHFAYGVHIHALRLCKLMSIGAPKIIIEHEARCLIGCMALHEYADCK